MKVYKTPKKMHQPFEGRNPNGKFTKITADMMTSSAWRDLTLRQRGLYQHLKAKYTQKTIHGIVDSNIDDISLPRSEWLPNLYTGYRTFEKDMTKLMENGFIRAIRRGGCERKCNIYGFTDDWTKWKPPPK